MRHGGPSPARNKGLLQDGELLFTLNLPTGDRLQPESTIPSPGHLSKPYSQECMGQGLSGKPGAMCHEEIPAHKRGPVPVEHVQRRNRTSWGLVGGVSGLSCATNSATRCRFGTVTNATPSGAKTR